MTPVDLFKNLTFGELAQQSCVDATQTTRIKADKLDAFIHFLNDGMMSLYSRFPMIQRDILLETKDPHTHYYLRPEFSHTYGDQTLYRRYLIDSPHNPFYGRVIRVLGVFDGYGSLLPMNDVNDPMSVFTPEFDCLQITANHKHYMFSVIYQSYEEPYTADDLTRPFEMAPFFHKALQSYVAGSYLKSIGSDTALARSKEHMNDYEAVCGDAEYRDLFPVSISNTNIKLDLRGYK